MRRSQSGFTLIEMMVVVTIISIITAVVFSLTTRTYGANAMNTAEQVSSAFNLCKMRAVSTRRWHRCEVTATAAAGGAITLYQWSAVGMMKPAGTCTLPATNCYQAIQKISLPAGGAVLWNAQTAIDISGGTSVAQNTALTFDFDFKPDGSSTGGTVFITDTQQTRKYRVLVYTSTGSSYARQNW